MLTLIMTIPEPSEDQLFLEELYRDYRRLLYWEAQKYLENPQDQEDVVHDSLVSLIQKIEKLRQLNRAERAGYLSATVRNTAYNHLKREKCYREKTGLPEPRFLQADCEAEDIVNRLDDRDFLLALGQKLTPEERLLLEGRYLLEKNDKELAGLLNCKPESVRMKLTRLRRSLRVYQQEMEGGTIHEG